MKLKLIFIIGLVIASFFSLTFWRVNSFLSQDRVQNFEASGRAELSALSFAIHSDFIRFHDKIQSKTIAPYYATAVLRLQQNKFEQLTQWSVDEKSVAKEWTADFIAQQLRNYYFTDKYTVTVLKDPKGQPYTGFVIKNENQAWLFIGSEQILNTAVELQKGYLGELSIINRSGIILSHGQKEYIGVRHANDDLIQETQNRQQSAGILSGEQTTIFSQIPDTNVFLIKSASTDDILAGQKNIYLQLILLSGGMFSVALALILLGAGSEDKNLEKLNNESHKWMQKYKELEKEKTSSIAISHKDEEGPLSADEKMAIYAKLASGFAHEMRGPVVTILGEAQIGQAKAVAMDMDKSFVQLFEKILKEARLAREILNKMFSFSGEKTAEKNKMKLDGPLLVVLKKLDPLFKKKNITVVKDIKENSPFMMMQSEIIKSIESVIMNAVEAMERMPKKELQVSLYEDEQAVRLKIRDTGEGIENQNLQKIFDPFYSTRGFQNHMGMGLPVALAISKEHNGTIEITSHRGEGTTVELKFLKTDVEAQVSTETIVSVHNLSTQIPHVEISDSEKLEVLTKVSEPLTKEKASPLDIDVDSLLELPDKVDLAAKTTVSQSSGIDEFEKIGPPQINLTNLNERESKLDSFEVEIRKPGMRL